MTRQAFHGGCHCGAVRYRATADISNVMVCNCSICHKKGTVLAFAPTTEFTLLHGDEALTEYRFNERRIQHLFCATCGVQSFSRGSMPDGTEMVAINVRCLDEVDLDTLEVQRINGRNF